MIVDFFGAVLTADLDFPPFLDDAPDILLASSCDCLIGSKTALFFGFREEYKAFLLAAGLLVLTDVTEFLTIVCFGTFFADFFVFLFGVNV